MSGDARNCHSLQGLKNKTKQNKRLVDSSSPAITIRVPAGDGWKMLLWAGSSHQVFPTKQTLQEIKWAKGVVLKFRLQGILPPLLRCEFGWWRGRFFPRALQLVPWTEGKRFHVLFCLHLSSKTSYFVPLGDANADKGFLVLGCVDLQPWGKDEFTDTCGKCFLNLIS